MNYLDFTKKLSKAKIAPFYIFLGKETFLREEGIKLLQKRLGDNVFFKEYRSGNELDIQTLMTDLRSDVLFEDLNLVIVRDADALLTSLHEPLNNYLKAPNPTSILILEIEKLDKRSKFARMATKKGVLIDCQPLYARPKPWLRLPAWESDLVKWVCSQAQLKGKKIHPKTAFFLTESVGNNLKDLESQLQKITLFIKEREEITAADIEQIVYSSKKIVIFDLLDAVCEHRLAQSLQMLQILFKNGIEAQDGQSVYDATQISFQLLRLLHFRFKQVWKIAISKDTSGIHDFVRKKLEQQAKKFTRAKLQKIWKYLLETEFRLKSIRVDPIVEIEQLILKISYA